MAVVLGLGRVLALSAALAAIAACGDDDAPLDRVANITIVNETGEEVSVFINGEHYSLTPGSEDAITLTGAEEYAILAVGVESGRTFFTESLTPSEIEGMGGRVVITAEDAT